MTLRSAVSTPLMLWPNGWAEIDSDWPVLAVSGLLSRSVFGEF